MTDDSLVRFEDKARRQWAVVEVLDENLPAGLLVFSSDGEYRVTWGAPIRWRDTANLLHLLDLAQPLHAPAPAA